MAQISIQEFRYVSTGTTFNTSFVAADNDAWLNTNATKLRITSIDKSGLTEAGIPDETVQTRLHGNPAPLVGLRQGSVKIGTYLGGGSSDTTADPYATLLSRMMGGITTLSAKTATVAASSTTTNVVSNGISSYLNNGQGVLINNEARVAVNVQANSFTLNMALSAAPSTSDTIVIAHTVYSNESASNSYFDWLSIGKSDADQRQGIGCQGVPKITGLAPGEAPKMEIDILCADHQWVASADRATLDTTTAVNGNDPPTGKSYGGFLLADRGAYESLARAPIRAGAFEIDLGVGWTKREDPNGVNGIGGWIRNPGKPTLSATIAYDEDMDGLKTDFENKTAKTAMLQLGTAAGKCVLVSWPCLFLDSVPVDTPLNNEAGVKLMAHAHDNYVSSEILTAPVSVHYF